MKDDANPFVVPGRTRSVESTRTPPDPTTSTRDAEGCRQGSNPFRWVVPDKPTSTGQEGALDNESNPTTLVSSPAVPTLVSSDGDGDHATTQINNNDALDRTRWSVGQDPIMTSPAHETEGPSIPRRTIPVGAVRLLEDHDNEDDDRTSVNGHSEDEAIWTGPVETGDRRVDDHTPEEDNGVSASGGVYTLDSTRLREGVQIGTVKRELLDYKPRTRRADRKSTRLNSSH